MGTPEPVYTSTVYITAPPERVWDGLTDPDLTRLWYFEAAVESSWEVGSPVVYRRAGAPLFEGTVLEIDPPRLLITTFAALFHPQARQERPCRVSWRLTPLDEDVRLTVTFDDLHDSPATAGIVGGGLMYPLQTLKAVLETGKRPPLANVTIDCAEPARLATFWQAATGYIFDGSGEDWAGLHDPRGVGPRLLFMRVPEPKTGKNRVHLDLRAADREAETERLVALGARRLGTVSERGQSWNVLADPEGNEFCLA